MIADRLQYRAAIYAAVYTPPLRLTRDQAVGLYKAIADSGFASLALKYTPEENEKPFKIFMEEMGEGRRIDKVTVDIVQGRLRLLIDQEWPDSFGVACKKADQIVEVFGEIVSECEVQISEARVRAQVPIGISSSKDYMISTLMPTASTRLQNLGQIEFLGLRLQTAPELVGLSSHLCAPAREVTIEPLRQEPGFLYLEVMSNWGRQALRPVQGKPGQAELVPGPLALLSGPLKPSEYLGEVKEYMEDNLCPFLEKGQ